MAHRHNHQALHLLRRAAAPMARPLPVPLAQIIDPSKAWLSNIVKRADEDTSFCTDNDTSAQCGKPSDSNNLKVPIALGVV